MLPLDIAIPLVIHLIKIALFLGGGAVLMTYVIYGKRT
jgi:hypothetical protein